MMTIFSLPSRCNRARSNVAFCAASRAMVSSILGTARSCACAKAARSACGPKGVGDHP